MWLAFPTSNYYGGSVAVPDIQRHLPRFSHLGFITYMALRIADAHCVLRSGLGNLRLDCTDT